MRSPAMVRFFAGVMRRQMARAFRAVRISQPEPDLPEDRPLLIYCNHPSWWDPALLIVLASELFPRREAYGPMEAAAIERYRFMKRIGIFGIEPDSPRGAAAFLREGAAILADSKRMLCVTAQGRFADPRVRPVAIRRGVSRLMRRVPEALAVPLALEYPFWTEKRPEALARFGQPLAASKADHETMEQALTQTMDRLAEDAMAADPAGFRRLVQGRSGVGGVYDLWRRGRAVLRGERFHAAHQSEER
ncbi:lysophospholipid acyltransferase family protein [Rhodobacteraceae bacterium MCCB 386]|nr:lysophospholipid acyltransferase family protein [Roseitranquillus sediminis]